MKYIVIENNGEVDPRAFYVMGMSSKVGDESTIGQFGTGNKYGIAALLRLGCSVTIKAGKKTLSFLTQDSEFRGQSFGHIRLKVGSKIVESSMTTEMGQLTWSVEQGVRELIANALDEGGMRTYETETISGEPGKTRIFISYHHQVAEFIGNLHEYFILDRKPVESGYAWDIYPKIGPGVRVYRRGVLVMKNDSEESLYDYDFHNISISEERTITIHNAKWALDTILREVSSEIAWKILESIEKNHSLFEAEAKMNYDRPSAQWVSAARDFIVVTKEQAKLYKARLFGLQILTLPEHWVEFFMNSEGSVKTVKDALSSSSLKGWEVVEPDDYAKELISESVSFLKTIGYKFDESIIKLARNDMENAPLGQYIDGTCYINHAVIRKGFEETLSCITEEVFHHLSKAHDETREFQQWILDELQYHMQRLYRYIKKEAQ